MLPAKTIIFLLLANLVVSEKLEDSPEKVDSEFISKVLRNDCTLQRFNKLEANVETLSSTIASIDTNIKILQDKSLVWDLFRHHIESWNEQIKSLDHKIDLIKRAQDENKIIETKLTSLEFTLNHILSKVVYMTDSNYDRENNKNKEDDKLIEIYKILSSEKDWKKEISSRLINILRHVLNIENDNCRSTATFKPNRPTRVVHPMAIASVKYNDVETILKNIELKVDNLTENLSANVLKQFITASKKNVKLLEGIATNINKIDERTIRIFDTEAHNSQLLTNCQSISNEITTFTESSDLLLKRIEKLVLNLQTKVNSINVTTKNDENESSLDNDEGTNDEEIDHNIESLESSNASVEHTEDLDFIQPYKSGCHELETRIDGIYKFLSPELNEDGRDANERYCTFPTDGVGYTVIQNRAPFENQENFNRSWAEYRNGFGHLNKDFWFGNEFIYRMVSKDNYQLRIELKDFDNNKEWAEYSTFQIESEDSNYTLMIGSYRGTIPDSLLYHHGKKFSTYDRRNDKSVEACCTCATDYGSGWWFDNCLEANLNGIYQHTPNDHNFVGIIWEHWLGDYSLKTARILIRPKNPWFK